MVVNGIHFSRKQYAFSVFVRFNGHFPSGPGLANTIMFPFWILLVLRMTEVVVTIGAIRRAKLKSNHRHQQTNPKLFYRPDALLVTQLSVRALKDKENGMR